MGQERKVLPEVTDGEKGSGWVGIPRVPFA